MTGQGLTWLADSPLAHSPGGFCLTLVRGAAQREVFAAFGAEADRAAPRSWRDLRDVMWVQVGRCGDWLFALELNSAHGTRPAVMRRVSTSGQSVTVRAPGDNTRYEFAYAERGDLIAAVNTVALGNWRGTDPDRIAALARETGLVLPRPEDAPHPLQSVLIAAEQISGAPLNWADVDKPLPAAELPPLPLDELHFCVTLTQGLSEDEAFRAFGADPAAAVPRRRRELEHGHYVQVGGSGDWQFALELRSHDGIRAQTLRRMSTDGRALTVHYELPELFADFGYAEDGALVARVNSATPDRWQGSDPARLLALAQEAGITGNRPLDGPTGARAMLTLAELVCGEPVTEAGGDRAWPTAPVLPLLKDVPAWSRRRVRPGPRRFGDPALDAALDAASTEELTAVLAVRLHRLMTETGLDTHRELATAVDAALAGQPQQVGDDDPAGLALRRIAWEAEEANLYRSLRVGQPPAPMDELERRSRLVRDVIALQLVLAGQFREALADEVSHQRQLDPAGWQDAIAWRERALADLAAARRR